MSTPYNIQRKAFIIFLAGMLALFLFILKPFWMPLVLGTVLVIIFYPLYTLLLRLFRKRCYLASFITTFSITVFIFLPAGIMTSLMANQISGVADQVIQFIEKGELLTLFQNWNLHLQHYFDRLEEISRVQVNLKVIIAETIKKFAFYIYQYSPSVVVQTVSFFLQAFLTLIVAFFLFVNGSDLYFEFIRFSPMKDTHEKAMALKMKDMIYSVVYGSLVTALVQGALAGIAFYFLNIQGYLVWGLVTFLFSFIPILGAAGVWVPATIILFLLGETKSAVFLLIYGTVLISGIDNVLKPILMKGKSELHPLLLFFSILGGVNLAGPMGILLGPIAVAVFIAALKIYKQEYLPENG